MTCLEHKKVILAGSVQVAKLCCSISCAMDSDVNTGYETLVSFSIGCRRKDVTKETGSEFM